MMVEDRTSDYVFSYNGGRVEPGETEHFRFTVTETYLGDPLRIPVSIINGENDGPIVFLTAASHGDELNGIEVVRSVSRDWDHAVLNGTLVCLPVLNVPGFLAQERYLPIQDRDLNRSFPGREDSTSAHRIAKKIWDNFIEPCDFGLDFHTSTRGRTNMFHVRADMECSDTERLARAFASNLIMNSEGSDGTLRREATKNEIPTITIEMGQAHRFERDQIDTALAGVRSVFAEYDIYPQACVQWPGWTEVIDGWAEKTWLRADAGGIVDMHYRAGELVDEGEEICTITNPFKTEQTTIDAPFTGLVVGALKNPVVYPGNPICHFVKPSDDTISILRKD